MKNNLVVYTYNVLFGDAILVEVPDGSVKRFILIDVGNVLSGEGGRNEPLLAAARGIKELTGGKIDLYIMTHEHMDHVQGLLYAKNNGCEFQIDNVWMTVSSDPEYYEKPEHEKARKKRFEMLRSMAAFQDVFAASEIPNELKNMLGINNPGSTSDCVDCIRKAVPQPQYVYRGFDISGKHPFTEAAIRILAPEEDSSDYYGPVPPRFDSGGGDSKSGTSTYRPEPLPGIDGGAFYGLIDNMNGACAEGIYAIDQAANNTSVVFELTWRGNRLLFTGDAEQKSWQFIDNNNPLQPVDFLKIGHHGSPNAAPAKPILDKILPIERKQQAVAVVSYFTGTYNGVPDEQALAEIQARTSTLYRTFGSTPGTSHTVTLSERS
jgi:beta-lactamase superfamily II metal-dependent hydrolase